MIAEFEATLRTYGPWFYRRLFWETGVIGQVLYLEAEAAGVRGTGVGSLMTRFIRSSASRIPVSNRSTILRSEGMWRILA
ncbi:MAG: hypothetical protein C4293_16305 [Nitrospiraceae bacterium]